MEKYQIAKQSISHFIEMCESQVLTEEQQTQLFGGKLHKKKGSLSYSFSDDLPPDQFNDGDTLFSINDGTNLDERDDDEVSLSSNLLPRGEKGDA